MEKRRRPSHKELAGKLRSARKAVSNGRILIIDQNVIAKDALELDYLFEDLPEILSGLLEDLKPEYYAGQRPPAKSYKGPIQGLELFAFAVYSELLKVTVYLKFSIKDGTFWLASLHRDRKKGCES